MLKTLKQYLSLRGLLARRLRAKKREIEAIKAKNRFYVCPYGVYDLSRVFGMLNYTTRERERIVDFMGKCGGYVHRIIFNDTEGANEMAQLILEQVSEQLTQLRAYD